MRLISAEPLKESMDKILMPGKDVVLESYIDEVVCAVIDDAPTVDAVPVIRCRDCGYAFLDRWHKSKQENPLVWRCRKLGRLTVPDGFCHRGKMREED